MNLLQPVIIISGGREVEAIITPAQGSHLHQLVSFSPAGIEIDNDRGIVIRFEHDVARIYVIVDQAEIVKMVESFLDSL